MFSTNKNQQKTCAKISWQAYAMKLGAPNGFLHGSVFHQRRAGIPHVDETNPWWFFAEKNMIPTRIIIIRVKAWEPLHLRTERMWVVFLVVSFQWIDETHILPLEKHVLDFRDWSLKLLQGCNCFGCVLRLISKQQSMSLSWTASIFQPPFWALR